MSGAAEETLATTERRDVVGASTPLLVSIAVSGVGGVAFSALAARQVDSEVVGVHATLFFWVMLVNQLTSLGLPVVVSRIPTRGVPSERTLFGWALSLTAASSLLGSAIAALLMRGRVRAEVQDALVEWGAWGSIALLALTVVGLSLALLVDLRLVALGKGRWVMGRVLAVNLLRCGLLLVPQLRTDAMSLLLLNAGINAASGIVGAVVLARLGAGAGPVPASDVGTTAVVVRDELRFGLLNWLGGLSVLLGQYGFPLVADASPRENAAFFLAWQMGAMVFVVPVMVGYAVVVSLRSDATSGRAAVRRGLVLSVGIVAACTVVAAVVGEPVLRGVFGVDYETAGTLLPWLLLAAVPWCWLSMSLAEARGAEDRPSVLALTVPYGPVVLALAWVMARDRSLDAARAWALGNLAAAALGWVAWTVNRRRRRQPVG